MPKGISRKTPGRLEVTSLATISVALAVLLALPDAGAAQDREAWKAWYYSSGASVDWGPLAFSRVPLDELRFGDFDGDGKTDIFRKTSWDTWEVSFAENVTTAGGRMRGWREVASSSISVTELRFGDFDGDGKTDVFRKTPRDTWEVSFADPVSASSGRMTSWREVARSRVALSQLRFGDFDGDGKTDVFRKTPRDTWEVSFADGVSASSGRMRSWREVATSRISVTKLRFGDFDCDGNTDVFRKTPRDTWEVAFADGVSASSGRMRSWREVASSAVPLAELRFGDFDGDGKTDVFRKTPRDTWEVSFAAAVTATTGRMASWQQVQTSRVSVNDLRFGDFNGDSRTDVFARFNAASWAFNVARVQGTAFNNDDADERLRVATELLQEDSGAADVGCPVRMVRDGDVNDLNVNGVAAGAVNTCAAVRAVHGMDADIKIASQLGACSCPGSTSCLTGSFNGCRCGNSLVITSGAGGATWAHEFGHERGLGHTGGCSDFTAGSCGNCSNPCMYTNDDIMFCAGCGGRDEVSASECDAYRGP